MGFLKGIVNTWKKLEAAVVVQNLLEKEEFLDKLDRPIKDLANYLVGVAWAKREVMMNGRHSLRLYKASIAAIALAEGLEKITPGHPNWLTMLRSLTTLMEEMEANSSHYPLSDIDQRFLGKAAETLNVMAVKQFEANEREFGGRS